MKLESPVVELGVVRLPPFQGIRVLQMPVILGSAHSLPRILAAWTPALLHMMSHKFEYHGQVGYVTIDERLVLKDTTHRRPGIHVDGVYKGNGATWGGGSTWSGRHTGMLTAASHVGCRAWEGTFEAELGPDGEFENVAPQLIGKKEITLQPSTLYWMGAHTVHESMPMPQDTFRQFVRISLPSDAPWFDGCTPNPLGIKPTGQILPRRTQFMKTYDPRPVSLLD